MSGSRRCVFQPLTRSKPSSSFASSRGISAGSSCRSASIVTTTSPSACAKPAASAAALPKFLRNRITRTLSCASCSRVSAETTRRSNRRRRRPPPKAGQAAGARTPARHRGAPPSAPRRERGRRLRSRRLSLSAARTVCAVVVELLTLAEAQRLVLERALPLPAERVPLEQAAGRVLAESASAVVDLPPFPSSAMDGFAVRGADTPGTLPVVFRVAAGRPSSQPCSPARRWGSPPAGSSPRAPMVSSPSSMLSTMKTRSRSASRLRPARTSGRKAAISAPVTRSSVRAHGSVPPSSARSRPPGWPRSFAERCRAPPCWQREPSFAGRASRSGRARFTRPTG